MKQVSFVLVLLALLLGLYWLPEGIDWFFSHQRVRFLRPDIEVVRRICDALGILVLLLGLMGLTYPWLWSARVFKSLPKGLLWAGWWVLVVYSASWGYGVARQIDVLYRFYKSGVGLEGRLFAADARLGHRGIPNASGAHVYTPEGLTHKHIPIQLDSLGFRTTSTPYPTHQADSLALFLGCSFTWGDYAAAEKTYAARVAQGLGVRYLNAGTSAYGLAQMLQLAEDLIPKERPQVVFTQFSPWLADRARFIFYPTAYGVMPFPYVYESPAGTALHAPLFLSGSYQPESDYFKTSPASPGDKLAFIRKIGFPMIILDGWKQTWALWRLKLGLIPGAVQDNAQIERFVYHRIAELCRQYGARLVVVNIGGFSYESGEARFKNHYDRARFRQTLSPDDYRPITFVDADSALRSTLRRPADYSQYVLWDKAGKDSVIFDLHPNPETHRRIAETVLNTLRR